MSTENRTIKSVMPSSGVSAIFKELPSGSEVRVPVACWGLRVSDDRDEVVGMIWSINSPLLHFVDDDDLFVEFVGYATKRGE